MRLTLSDCECCLDQTRERALLKLLSQGFNEVSMRNMSAEDFAQLLPVVAILPGALHYWDGTMTG